MNNSLKVIQALDTPRDQTPAQRLKSRRERRQEERDRVKTTKLNQKKIG